MDTMIANTLKREAVRARIGADPLATLVLFCGVGLLATLCLVSLGFDVNGAF
jgi:hypothetical protein